MSIFPKRVTCGENVIIHIKFINENKETCLFNFQTQVISPSGRIIVKWEKSFIMAPKSHDFVNKKEFYYQVNGKLLKEAGKYITKTALHINGRIINSYTNKTDFFFVDGVKASVYLSSEGKICYELSNRSDNSEVCFSLIKGDGTVIADKRLNENQKCKISTYEKIRIKYENNTVKELYSEITYIKHPKFDYRIENNRVQVFDDTTLEACVLPNLIAYIWLECDGLTTAEDIAQKTQLCVNDVQKILRYLEIRNFIVRVFPLY